MTGALKKLPEFEPALGISLWLVDLDAGSKLDGRRGLSDDEWRRADRFVFADDRRRFIAAHAGLRQVLSHWAGEPAAELQFEAGPFGKPVLSAWPQTQFNLSHSGDAALIGVADGVALGVDIERLRPMADLLALAQRVFTPGEQQALEATDLAQRAQAFFRGWTRKEACLKAVGSGLSIEPNTFEAGLVPEPREIDMPAPWGRARVGVASLDTGLELAAAVAWVC
jgi:4'-phosphopantetheinyl transferase